MSPAFAPPPGIEPGRIAPPPGAPAPAIEPYRVMFPLGVALALAGTVPWVIAALGGPPWPVDLHIGLMIEGFELSFVLGFLLTAMPAFTRGGRCTRAELAVAVASVAAFVALAHTPFAWSAHLAGAEALALIAWALGSRIARSGHLPPEEFLFVALGLVLGVLGVAVRVAEGAAGWTAPAVRAGERLLSLGFTLSVVLGVGGLLVPTFAGIRDPLNVPGVAKPHEREGRRRLFAVVALLLVGAFALEWTGHGQLGALARALGASVMLLMVWKIWRGPGQRGFVPRALWLSGWFVLVGLWWAAAWPAQAPAGLHVMFVGGYGLLTLGIASRVTVAHGRHPFPDEARLLTPLVMTLVFLALAARLAGALWGAAMLPAYGVAAALWMCAWAAWAMQALPRQLKVGGPRASGPVVQVGGIGRKPPGA